jgi:DNA invertase Pin-like site-specific DNA recombinase
MEHTRISTAQRQRTAVVYVRQSSPTQLERNPESTTRQYQLVARAQALGWAPALVRVIDEDLGLSASGTAERVGFAHLTAEVALSHVGIVLGLEVSRLARNNADWYRLLDLCGLTGTLLADEDGIYDPSVFNDRLVLGLKGTMSEAELHVLRARLDGGIRHKAARGELRRGLPVGLVWGDEDGEIRFHPDEAITHALRTVFERFAELGSVRRVWLWLRSEGLLFPFQRLATEPIQWLSPSYLAIHHVLTNPSYAGAYTYGKTRQERYVDQDGRVRQRTRQLPRAEWAVLIPHHHPGFITWETYLANQERIGANTRPRPHQAGGAVREGAALLQGLAVCGRCGRRLRVSYHGRNATPAYYCSAGALVNGRGTACLRVGGQQIDAAVAATFLATCTPAGLQAALAAAERLEADHDAALTQRRQAVERARYEALRAERRYRAVDPEHRLVARGLEREWEQRLQELATADAALAADEQRRPRGVSPEERLLIEHLGNDLERVWTAPSTSDRDRKELLRTLLEEVIVQVDRPVAQAQLTVRWRGGALTELAVPLPRSTYQPLRTDEETLALLRRLAVHYPDAVIAGILNRQGRRSARGERFTASIVSSLRTHWSIPRHQPPATPPEGALVTVTEAARQLGVAPSTLHRWLQDGFLAGEQLTPGAPWQIRLTDGLRARFTEDAPPGWLPMRAAMKALGVSRQTVLQRVKRGQLRAVHVHRGRQPGLRIEVPQEMHGMADLFAPRTGSMGAV